MKHIKKFNQINESSKNQQRLLQNIRNILKDNNLFIKSCQDLIDDGEIDEDEFIVFCEENDIDFSKISNNNSHNQREKDSCGNDISSDDCGSSWSCGYPPPHKRKQQSSGCGSSSSSKYSSSGCGSSSSSGCGNSSNSYC